MTYREVIVDGITHGYVADDDRGRAIADRYVFDVMSRTGYTRPVGGRIPQGSARLDRDPR